MPGELNADMSTISTSADEMVEREAELTQLRGALVDAARTGTISLIESPAGTGRTRLLTAAASLASESGARVMQACGRDSERSFNFGVALQLFERCWLNAPPEDQARLFDGPAQLAAPLMGKRAQGAGGAAFADVFGIVHGLFWLTRNLAAPSEETTGKLPVALLIDDVHRADRASLYFLAYLGCRIRTLPLCLIVTSRTGEPATDEDALSALRSAATIRLSPTDLSVSGAGRLARRWLPEAGPELWRACVEATGGNPLLLHALLHEVSRLAPAPTPHADVVVGDAPRVVVDWTISRLKSLPAGARSLAAAVAASVEPPSLQVAASAAGLAADDAARSADALAGIGLLYSGTPLSFSNLMMARAVRQATPAAERDLLQARAEGASRPQARGRTLPTINGIVLAEPGSGRREESPPPADDRLCLAQLAVESALRGEHRTRVIKLAELAWSDRAAQPTNSADAAVATQAATALLIVDELELGLEILADSAQSAPNDEDQAGIASATCRTWMLYHRGEVMAAMASAQSALDAAEATGRPSQPGLQAARAACLIQLAQLADSALIVSATPRDVSDADLPLLLEVRAQLALAGNRPHEALKCALEAGRTAARGASQPGFVTWRTTAALAQLALDEPVRARELAEEELELARSGGVTRATLRSLRVLGLASTGTARFDVLEEAVALGADGPVRLEYLHALVDLGAAARRANRRAAVRQPLTKALELARELGVICVAERAMEEMAAGTGRRRRPRQTGTEALTPSERRVAQLAAQGHTTRQIAAELFVTPKTVEFHLHHVYRKLGIPSTRAALASVLHENPAPTSGPEFAVRPGISPSSRREGA